MKSRYPPMNASLPPFKTCLGTSSLVLIVTWLFLVSSLAAQNWQGFVDANTQLQLSRLRFHGSTTEGPGNENYYDGDFADFDGDGHVDRILGARYGLLINRGNGWMDFFAGRTGFEFQKASPSGINGEDAFQWADIDNDDDFDAFSGGNGETLSVQENRRGRFSVKHLDLGGSALIIANTDIEGDGDVDMVVAHAFCWNRSCGGPVAFNLFVNDGFGNFTKETNTRGLSHLVSSSVFVTGVVSGDVDADGDYDLLVSHGHSSDPAKEGVEVLFNNGNGYYSGTINNIPPSDTGFNRSFQLGDIDDDGDLDMIKFATRWEPSLGGNHPVVGHVIAINDGSGGFTDESNARFTGSYPGDPMQYWGSEGILADVDYDGDLDIVSTNGVDDYLTVFLNNGSGQFTLDPVHSIQLPDIAGTTSGIGNDTDLADIDGDGTYDIWLGRGADQPHVFLNPHGSPDGLPADVPRNLQVTSTTSGGITLRWEHPPFASANRYYKIYRSCAPNLEPRDRQLIKVVGERHQDEKFFAPITRHTTTAYLGDPDVVLDGPGNAIEFTDTTAVPGITYFYAVQHVGAENSPSRHTTEVSATIAPPGGADTTGPELNIISPTQQDWDQYARIVLTYSDDKSGIDLSTLSVSFNRPLGDGTSAGANLAGSFHRKDDTAYISALATPRSLPLNQVAMLTVQVSDLAGNQTQRTMAYFPSVAASSASDSTFPTASFTEDSTGGPAPFTVNLNGSGSHDNDVGGYPADTIFRWEWYFSDGTTALGRETSKTFAQPGTHSATLLIRDNEGSVDTLTRTYDVTQPSQTYESFKMAHFDAAEQANPAISGETADPDGDRFSNLLEYYLVMDPRVMDLEGFESAAENGELVFRHKALSNATDPLTVEWQSSLDLQNWQSVVPDSQVTLQDHGDSVSLEVRFVPTSPAEFFRLRVAK